MRDQRGQGGRTHNLCIDVRSASEKEFDNFFVTVLSSDYQRRHVILRSEAVSKQRDRTKTTPPCLVSCFLVRPHGKKKRHGFLVTICGSDHQWRESVLDSVGAGGEQVCKRLEARCDPIQ